MEKEFFFFRGYLDRETAVDGEPGLFAATEVVRAVCDADFQKNNYLMMNHSSSPNCYYKYAKLPENGMYMLRAVKKEDMTTLDILIDTRLYPCFVMIENNPDWQEETEEIRNTLEQAFNEDADELNWHVNLREYKSNKFQHMYEFFTALGYMYGPEFLFNMNIGQLLQRAKTDNHFDCDMNNEEPFKFIHPSICDEEIWQIHNEVKRLVTNHKVPEICAYLKELKQMKKVLLPSSPEVMYNELVRLGMPKDKGFTEKHFKNYYLK